MLPLPTFSLITPIFTLVLATDPRLLDRNADPILLRRTGDPELEIMECGQLPPNPTPTAIPLQPGMQLMECRPLQRESAETIDRKPSSDDSRPDPNAPSLRTSSTFSKTDDNITDSDDLFSLQFPSEHASPTYSKFDDDVDVVPSLDLRDPLPLKSYDDDPLESDRREASLNDSDDDSFRPEPDATSLRSSSSHSNPNEDNQPGSSQRQDSELFNSAIGDSSKQPFGSEIEFTTSPRLGNPTMDSPVQSQYGSGDTLLTVPQRQECMQCAQECAEPGVTLQQVVEEACPHGPATRQSEFCTKKKKIICTISAVTCCAFLATFLAAYEQA